MGLVSITDEKGQRLACGGCPIQHRAVCSRCNLDELVALENIKSYKTFEAGQTIVWAGEEMRFVASVVTGVVSLTQTMEDGRRQMVGLLLPSDFIGHPGRVISPFDVVAATEVKLCRFERKKFEKLLLDTPSIAGRLLEMTLNELDSAREWMLVLGRKTAREKISSLLAIMARRETNLQQHPDFGAPVHFDLHLTREAMADYLGLTLETVSRQFSALRKAGVITLEGKRHVTVPSFVALLNETGDDADGGMIN
jgi:CRP/FNR family transcriptional regulator, anaerobic regulatory protein